ncbi:hypothetical protein HDU76_001680, partial [Blyttiomyces sp. JEL0837]
MIANLFVIALAAALASAYPSQQFEKRDDLPVGVYAPAGPTDARSPCPVFNIMANQGYFPRNGKQLSKELIISGLVSRFGVTRDVITLLADAGFSTNPTLFGVRTASETFQNGTEYFNLDDLNLHNAIEHDASLTRFDNHLGNNHLVQESLVTRIVGKSQDGKYLTLQNVADYRVERYNEMKAANSEFNFGPKQELLAWGESALFFAVLRDSTGNVPVQYFTEFFLNETFPAGWTKPAKEVGSLELGALVTELKTRAGFR